MKKNKIMYRLLDSLCMEEKEIKEYEALPDNLPENKLTAKQKDYVHRLYYKYIEHKITVGWGTELWELEKREKWPSGSRVKDYEAKRMILSNLVFLNTKKELTAEQAADKFHACLNYRDSYTKLMQYAYKKI